jgi:hypothetical protein
LLLWHLFHLAANIVYNFSEWTQFHS